MPPKEGDEGSGIEIQQINSEAIFCQKLVFDFSSELVWSFWVAFPSSVSLRLPPSPRGRLKEQRPQQPPGERAEARKQGDPDTPLQCQPYKGNDNTEQDDPV